MDSKTGHAVIDLMEEQKSVIDMGGTMRLGAYTCMTQPRSLAHKVYGRTEISERHRHRFEFNNEYKSDMENSGLVFSGMNPESGLVEIIELPDHPFFIGVQFHPEYKSTVANPHPLFKGLIEAAVKEAESVLA